MENQPINNVELTNAIHRKFGSTVETSCYVKLKID